MLDGVDLDVAAGEAVALLGANGAGKTTLLKIVATLLRPTRGTAQVAGHDCVRDAESALAVLGVVTHGNHIYEDLTARENLDRHATARVRTFSAGMRRRLALARLSLTTPRVLLLDEPFAGLDQRARKWLEGRLEAFKAGGGALLMATHSFGRELGLSDRLAILAAGRVALDTPRAGLDAQDVQRLYLAHAEDLS